ncbi:MAG TPA: signal peptidase II [Bacilli bacterium]|nr:signal peptidase II [Bacilli bacterium]
MRNKIIFNLNWKKLLFSFYWLVVLLIIVDQASKALFLHLEATQGPGFELTIIDNFFYFSYTRNTGAAWSILRDYPIFLVLISLFAGGAMLAYRIIKRKELSSLYKAAWALAIAGTFGNFIDRAFYKLFTGRPGVVDFLHFRFGNYDFPIFNVADMCLVIGLFGLIIMGFIDDNKPKLKQEAVKVEDPRHE